MQIDQGPRNDGRRDGVDTVRSASEAGYSLVNDPLFFVTAAFFALVTTALPAGLGWPRFLPIAQSAALMFFVAICVRRRQVRAALMVMAIWFVVEILVMATVASFLGGQVERAVADGFLARGAYLEWFFTGTPYPGGWLAEPLDRLLQLVVLIAGSLATGGLAGVWLSVGAANMAGFFAGSLIRETGSLWIAAGALPIWTILWLAGFTCATVLLAEPLLTGNWSPAYYLRFRRRLMVSVGLFLVTSSLIELVLGGVWYRLF